MGYALRFGLEVKGLVGLDAHREVPLCAYLQKGPITRKGKAGEEVVRRFQVRRPGEFFDPLQDPEFFGVRASNWAKSEGKKGAKLTLMTQARTIPRDRKSDWKTRSKSSAHDSRPSVW